MARWLSDGKQHMLTIARSPMGNPAVLLLYEPSKGLACLVARQIGALMRRPREVGTTIIPTEQHSRFGLAIATSVAVPDQGIVVWRVSVE